MAIDGNIVGLNFGADGPASVGDLRLTSWTNLAGITEVLSTDGKTLTATIDGSGGQVFYTLVLNTNGTYTFNLVTPQPTQTVAIGSQFGAGGPAETLTVNAGGNAIVFDGLTFNATTGVAINSPASGQSLDDLNPNSIGFGIQNGNIDDNEGFKATATQAIDGMAFTVVGQGNLNATTIIWKAYAANGVTVVDSGTLPLSGLNAAGNGGLQIAINSDVEFRTLEVRFDHPASNDAVRIQNFFVLDRVTPPDVGLTFTATATDGDGDTVAASFAVSVVNVDPLLIEGSNAHDQTGQTIDHVVPKSSGPVDGPIIGAATNDILVGDTGGSTAAGIDANIILVLDTSGSMTETISFGGAAITRMQALKNAVTALLNSFATSGGDNIRVLIVDFDDNAVSIGPFDIRAGGVTNSAQLTLAINAVNGLTADSTTNYEAGLQQALNWISGTASVDPIENADLNKLIFVSDGEPNRAYSGNGTSAVDTVTTSEALAHLSGTGFDGDTVNEIASSTF